MPDAASAPTPPLFHRLRPALPTLVPAAGFLVFFAFCGWQAGALPTPRLPDPGAQAELLSLARTAFAAPETTPVLPDHPAREDVHAVIVTAYFPGTSWEPATGWQDVEDGDVAAAVALAGAEAGRQWRMRDLAIHGKERLRIDLTGPERPLLVPRAYLDRVMDPGIDGVVVRLPDGVAFGSPSARAELSLTATQAVDRVVRDARGRGGRPRRYRAASFMEGPAGAPVTIVRGNVLPPYPATAEDLRLASARGGAYLARMVDSRGRFVYRFDARNGRPEGGYNLLRHAGTVWSMFQVVGMNGDRGVRGAAERALAAIGRDYAWRDPRHPDAIFLREPSGDIKLGACGLGVLAFVEAERAGVVLTEDQRALLTGLGNGILAMQKPDGELRSYHTAPGTKVNPRRSVYYPGEAILALAELHARDGDAKWLEAATRAADFQVERRWRKWGIEIQVPPDAWLAQALEKLWLATKDERYERYAYKIADELLRTSFPPRANVPADLRGASFDGRVTRVTPTSSRNEAVVAVARLARAAGESAREERYLEAARAAAWFGIAQQYRPENSHFLRSPEIALGGIRESVAHNSVQIDGVQHALSGFMGLAEMLEPGAHSLDAAPAVTGTSGEGS